MVQDVIKKDGTKVPFDAEKIKKAITAAAAATDLSEERKNEVAEQVSDTVVQTLESKNEATTGEIKTNVLAELDKVEPSVSA
ncbi:hypothetical protein KKH26_00345, partial [Patescibacteria group bacterium]|nr:hypothetical protein [Patescibacteria group bacterium]